MIATPGTYFIEVEPDLDEQSGETDGTAYTMAVFLDTAPAS